MQKSLTMVAVLLALLAQARVLPAQTCEDFETGYTLDTQLRTHPDWFYESSGSGPVLQAGIGVAGSIGLTNGDRAFSWVAHPFTWSDTSLLSVWFQMDYQTSAGGAFDDDRLGWSISDTDDSSDWNFGVQLDPGGGGAGGNIECYWDGNSFGDNGGRSSIVDLPALTGDTWYRLRAEFTKLTATSCRIDVSLTELDASGNELATIVTGSLPDTDALPNTAGQEIPNPGYFTAATMWPLYKNYQGAAGAADNACFGIVSGTLPEHTLTVTTDGNGTVTLDPPGGLYVEGTVVELTAAGNPGYVFDFWSGDAGGSDNPLALAVTGDLTVTANFMVEPDLAAGDVIISSLQSWNDPSGQSPGEFVELFNTTDAAISLAGLELISRVDNNADGVVDIDWQLAADLTGKVIVPHGFFLIGESGVAGENGVVDVTTDMDLATGEGGSSERAISLEAVIDGVHMDFVIYGRHDGSSPAGELPPGDVAFDGGSWPRVEVCRNTRGTDSFQEGLLRRETALDLYAGHAVEGYYTDEGSLGSGYPNGVWTCPHSETYGSYTARNSTSAAVDPVTYTLSVTVEGNGSVTLDPPAGPYLSGTTVELTAAADPDWEFQGWSGDLTGSENPATILMDGPKTVTATFEESAVPVWLSDYSAIAGYREVAITWSVRPGSEIGGFHIYRACAEQGPYARLNQNRIEGPGPYRYTDSDVAGDTVYWYRIGVEDLQGQEHVLYPINLTTPVWGPSYSKLDGTHPNPFNPTTTIVFSVARSGHVRLRVFDFAGRAVRTLVDESREMGRHSIVWDGRSDSGESMPSGSYLVRLDTDTGVEARKVMLVR